jgi:tryprostatin B 6-hydroxylase
MESRVAAALLLTQLKFRFPAGQTGQSLFTEATDFFTTTPGPLEVIVEERV